MEKILLLCRVATLVIMPLFAISVVYRLIQLVKKRFFWKEIRGLDILNLCVCFIMPLNMINFWKEQPEIFISTLWSTVLCLVALGLFILLIAIISKVYTAINPTNLTGALIPLFIVCAVTAMAYYNATHQLSIGQMFVITLIVVVASVLIAALKPVFTEFKLRELRKTLNGERQEILYREKLKYKRLKSQKLRELQAEYRKLHPDDYAQYHRYSKNKNYPRPLVSGEEIICLRLNVIGKELRQREWYS